MISSIEEPGYMKLRSRREIFKMEKLNLANIKMLKVTKTLDEKPCSKSTIKTFQIAWTKRLCDTAIINLHRASIRYCTIFTILFQQNFTYWVFVFSSQTFHCTKNESSIEDFFSKCDQIRRKLRLWSHLLKKSLLENFILCAVFILVNFMKEIFFLAVK